uniref:SH2 domain-containing protein n=1 Tax=Rhabditophanes sp. KR3021 TaxID=114890 RepID=A0AC35TWR1_9BILA
MILSKIRRSFRAYFGKKKNATVEGEVCDYGKIKLDKKICQRINSFDGDHDVYKTFDVVLFAYNVQNKLGIDRPQYLEIHQLYMSQPWYLGNITRKQAIIMLSGTENGTFIVRNNIIKKRFILSVSFSLRIQHIEIKSQGNKYYIKRELAFLNLIDLVNYFSTKSFLDAECFNYDTRLSKTFLPTKLCIVLEDFNPAQFYHPLFEVNQFLKLREGEIVQLVDLIEDADNLWLGKMNGKIGFFPKQYVEFETTLILSNEYI